MCRPLFLLFHAAILTVLVQPPQLPVVGPVTPNQVLAIVAADIATIPTEARPFIRYLSLHNFGPEERLKIVASVNFMVNSLSRVRALIPVVIVGGVVARVNLDLYEIKTEDWDKVIRDGSGINPTLEPYFHLQLLKVETYTEDVIEKFGTPDGKNADGTPRYKNVREVKTLTKKERKVKVAAQAPWLDPALAVALATATHSEFALCRADWWIYASSIPPGYYVLAGLGNTLEDFETRTFATKELAAKARLLSQGIAVFSEVAIHNRSLLRYNSIVNYYWESADHASSANESDLLQNLLDDKRDAVEAISSIPNGLQLYFLADGKGKRLDSADPNVAIDTRTTLQQKLVFSGRNCTFCHSEGIIDVADEVRALSQEKVALLIVDPVKAKKVRDQFFATDLSASIKADQLIYKTAVKATTGMDSKAFTAQFQAQLKRYYEDPVTPAIAAAECGITEAMLLDKLKMVVGIDARAAQLLQIPPRPVRRDHWEQTGYPQIMSALGVK